jgi:thioredoxin reductase (NADPH)
MAFFSAVLDWIVAHVVPIGVAVTILMASRRLFTHKASEKHAAKVKEENDRAGLNEPASLHPIIDVDKCIGCGSCVDACPESHVLEVIAGKAVLVEASHCIGHGACKPACPTRAIELVFGTEKRGQDIPNVRPNFETNVPGIFIAGELGGMGLIANAIEQGRQALDNIRQLPGMGSGGGDMLDVLIVGAGPAGFSATLGAHHAKMKYRTISQDSLGGTVFNFPRGKIVMTRPAQLPIVGKVKITETSKEKLVEFWQKVEKDTKIKINYGERLDAVTKNGEGFIVKTSAGEYKARTVLLCLGRMGTPRKLGVPGEEDKKVTYRLLDPKQYEGKSVLVVGGGDSALEAAHSIADERGAKVILSYREKAITRAKPKNRAKVEAAVAAKKMILMLESKVKAVHPESVEIEWQGKVRHVQNDAIIVCAGGLPPSPFLKSIGITVETKHGTV